jgi:serine/threonine protein kinase
MDAELLIGKVLGGCLLQQEIGSGTMGVVYRAMQTHPFRQVAVKVMTRAATLDIQYQIEFLDRFRGAIARAATLKHSHIVPVYEHGDLDGLAYVVMADMQGETLEDMLARRGSLELSQALRYLEQVADTLDYAHARGVIHRDLKPANVFIDPDGQALVADFHITSLLIEGTIAPMRLSRPGLLDYMSPELVIGKAVDGRADIYSLGAMLFRVVTGAPPFQGQTLIKVANRHLKSLPPSPRALRPDLPVAAEQAILKALEKNPADRYENARDLALLFRQALQGDARRTQFKLPQMSHSLQPPLQPAAPAMLDDELYPDTGTAPGGSTTDALPLGSGAFADQHYQPPAAVTDPRIAPGENGRAAMISMNTQPQQPVVTGSFNRVTPHEPSPAGEQVEQAQLAPDLPPPALAEATQENTGTTGTLKLTGPARLVSIPVVGQPGQFVTGIVSAQPSQPTGGDITAQAPVKPLTRQRKKIAVLVLASLLVLLVLPGSVIFWLAHSTATHPASQAGTGHTAVAGTPDLHATATAQAVATLQARTILYDPLSQNIHNWPVNTSGPLLYQFEERAYHITDNDPSRIAPAILQGKSLDQPYAYSLTMEEIHGDDTSINNEFGMIVRFTSQQDNGRQVVRFYSFEVLNSKGGQYQFWLYDNSSGPGNPWKELAQHPFGSEFHQGQGPQSVNTFKILVSGKNFTLIVNGKQVWSVSDGSLTSGGVGMLVNLKGTEVAFSDLRLTGD